MDKSVITGVSFSSWASRSHSGRIWITVDIYWGGICIHSLPALTPYSGQQLCFPHVTDGRNQHRESEVSKVVNCPGEVSRQAAGSGSWVCVCSQQGRLLDRLWAFSDIPPRVEMKEPVSSALSKEITSSHKIWRRGNASPKFSFVSPSVTRREGWGSDTLFGLCKI